MLLGGIGGNLCKTREINLFENFKMASDCQEFPSESFLQELISSFPQKWQGLFAALNVQESIAISSGTKWLRDNSCEQKNYIRPHWPELIRSLCLMFPVILNNHVVFWPKFTCFTFKIQRNMLCFIVYHSDSIPVDDIKVTTEKLVEIYFLSSIKLFNVYSLQSIATTLCCQPCNILAIS